MRDAIRGRPAGSLALVVMAGLVAVQVAGTVIGSFRADDWLNLEQGARALDAADWRTTWTRLNAFTLYRPLVDLWHGLALRAFGLNSTPMMMMLVALLGLDAWMLARLARARGASAEASRLVALAAWAQVNAYTWTTLWVSNATGSLMATFALAALLLHHRAVRLAGQGRPRASAASAMLSAAAFLAGALCKEEVVLLVPALAVMEFLRADRMSVAERRSAEGGIGLLAVACAGYLYFRTQVLPTPQIGGARYHLTLGPHVLQHAAFFALHLGALPIVGGLLAWLMAGRRMPWPAGGPPRETWVGLAWAAVAILLYLPIQGFPAYGYLYLPGLAVAYAVGCALGDDREPAPGPERGAGILAVHAVVALALTIAGLSSIAWPRFRGLIRGIETTLREELPDPPRGAELVFLDAGEPTETARGRTLFNFVLDDATGSFLRLHYRRADVFGRVLHGEAAREAETDPPPATAVFDARLGRIVRIARTRPRPGAVHDSVATR